MELKHKTYLEITKEGRTAQLVIDQEMPIGSIYDALVEMKSYVFERIADAEREQLEGTEETAKEVSSYE